MIYANRNGNSHFHYNFVGFLAINAMKTMDELTNYALPKGASGWTRMTREDLEDLVKRTQEDAMTCSPLNKQLLVDLEAWRAYLRVVVEAVVYWETSDAKQGAFRALAIADDALALSLNNTISQTHQKGESK